MRFGSILKKYLLMGRTGQLVVKFAGEEYLCKIYIDDGNAVQISMGSRKPHDILSHITEKEVEGANFIEGVLPLKRLDEPLNDKLFMLVGTEKVTRTSDSVAVEGVVTAKKVDALLDNFIDIVGPLGIVIADKVFSNLGYSKGSEMGSEDYSVLFSSLLDDVPENKKMDFRKKG